MKINTLRLENFQGIKAATFDFKGQSASVYGDNATGKTSVSPELLLPEWEIKQGGKFILPYLDIINNLFAGRDKPHGAE